MMDKTKRWLVLGATAVVLTPVAATALNFYMPNTPIIAQAFFRDSPKELVDEVWQIVDLLDFSCKGIEQRSTALRHQ